MPRMRTAPVILALFVAASANASGDARAEDCLAGPNGASPAGKHWYYRIDRATHRKCWYLGGLDGRRHHAASARTAASASRNAEARPAEDDAPEAAPPAASPAPPAASAAPPQPAFGTRWPDDAPRAAADGAPPQDRVAAAGVALLPDRVAARPVPVERIAREPAPPKPQEAVTVRLAAAPPPAAASLPPAAAGKHGALPAALFGIALLFAVLGVILVRARRRIIVRVADVPTVDGPALAPGREEHVRELFTGIRRGLRGVIAKGRRDEEQEPARRSLHEILADADGDEQRPDTAFLARAVGSVAAADIAAATLQPAIDPLPPEPMAPTPDVEQSLRQLLAEWERRAA